MCPVILHIETSAEVCSVALSHNNECRSFRENSEGRNHAVLLTSFIEQMLCEQNIKVNQLDAISVSAGPGSYTGLRIGLSTAKGLCYGADIPLISVSTLKSMSRGLLTLYPETAGNGLFCPMIDARRMEVYTALFDQQGNQVKNITAEIITNDSFAEWLRENIIYFFGNGAVKCKELISHPNAVFIDDYQHSAVYMIEDALIAYNNNMFEDIAYFEPFYLKDFIAGKPKQIFS